MRDKQRPGISPLHARDPSRGCLDCLFEHQPAPFIQALAIVNIGWIDPFERVVEVDETHRVTLGGLPGPGS